MGDGTFGLLMNCPLCHTSLTAARYILQHFILCCSALIFNHIFILLLLFSSCTSFDSPFSSFLLLSSPSFLWLFFSFLYTPSSLSSSNYYFFLHKLNLLQTVILIRYHHLISIKIAVAAAVAVSVTRQDTVKEDERNNCILQYDVQWNGMQMHILFFHVMSCHVMSCHVMSCHVTSCHIMSYHVMLYDMVRYNMIRYNINLHKSFPGLNFTFSIGFPYKYVSYQQPVTWAFVISIFQGT